jgi:Transglycosylase-like domain/Putative peptidoglycan binding domain
VASHRDLGSPVVWRRSLRASRQRRERRARRRRIALRGRAGIVLAVAFSCLAAGGALAQSSSAPSTPSKGTVRAVQQKLGLKPDGVYGRKTRAAVKRFQRAHGLTADGIVGPQTLAALGLSDGTGASTTAGGAAANDAHSASATAATLQRIAQCESGGNPSAVSADGTYHGKYQFDLTTWRQLGGSGDPAQAPESEQDRRAATLYAARGSAPWPNCA